MALRHLSMILSNFRIRLIWSRKCCWRSSTNRPQNKSPGDVLQWKTLMSAKRPKFITKIFGSKNKKDSLIEFRLLSPILMPMSLNREKVHLKNRKIWFLLKEALKFQCLKKKLVKWTKMSQIALLIVLINPKPFQL
jgi:hypothetical protein